MSIEGEMGYTLDNPITIEAGSGIIDTVKNFGVGADEVENSELLQSINTEPVDGLLVPALTFLVVAYGVNKMVEGLKRDGKSEK